MDDGRGKLKNGGKEMNRKEILENALNNFVSDVKKTYHPDKIILFGSYASGKVNDNSDLDLLVVAPSKDDFWTRMKDISGCCSRTVGMDVLFYTPAEYSKMLASRTFFRKEIQDKGKIIYDKAKST